MRRGPNQWPAQAGATTDIDHGQPGIGRSEGLFDGFGHQLLGAVSQLFKLGIKALRKAHASADVRPSRSAAQSRLVSYPDDTVGAEGGVLHELCEWSLRNLRCTLARTRGRRRPQIPEARPGQAGCAPASGPAWASTATALLGSLGFDRTDPVPAGPVRCHLNLAIACLQFPSGSFFIRDFSNRCATRRQRGCKDGHCESVGFGLHG
jgi:hypothetical protein